jgi:hypothetical protein
LVHFNQSFSSYETGLPNTTFNGACDSRVMAKSCGCVGPAAPVASVTFNPEMFALIMSAIVPLLGGLSRKHSRSESPVPLAMSTPKCSRLCHPTVESPLPEDVFFLCACLHDMAKLEGIDLTSHEVQLWMEDFTPHIIPFVDDASLSRLISITNGFSIKLKVFCKEWFNCYKAKHHVQLKAAAY